MKNKAKEELQSIVGEIESLMKSLNLSKADEDEMPPPPMGDAGGVPPPPMGDNDGDEGGMPPPPMEGGPEGDPESDAAHQADEGAENLEEEVKGLSDEELQNLMEIVSNELSARQSQPAEGGVPPPPPAGGDDLAMSLKSEFKSLAKSVATLANEVASLKSAKPRVANKPAATNVTPMQKSNTPKTVTRLSKSETQDYLLGQMRAKNKNVSSADVAAVTSCKSEADLAKVQDSLKIKGISLPEK